MATFRATNKTKYLDYAIWWGEQQSWITCNYPKVLTEHAAANDMSCGQTFAEVYMHYATQGIQNDTYIAHIRDKVLKVVVERNQIDDWWWDDAYFMAMGTFARIGNITGSRDFHDKNFALYNDSATRRGLWSVPNNLYFRDESYKDKTAPNGCPLASLASSAIVCSILFNGYTRSLPSRSCAFISNIPIAELPSLFNRGSGLLGPRERMGCRRIGAHTHVYPA